MNFTIPAADLRRMVDRLKPCRGSGLWAGLFDVYADDEMAVTCQGETVSAVASAKHPGLGLPPSVVDHAVLPLARLDAWLAGVDGTVTATQDGTIVTFETDDASLPVPVVPGYEPELPPVPDTALPLPGGVWAALGRVSWATRRIDGNPPSAYNMLHVVPGHVWASDDKGFAMVAMDGIESPVSFYPELGDVLRVMTLEDTAVTVDEDRRLHLVDGMGRYVMPTFAGTVPGIDRLAEITAGNVHHATFNRKELHDALGRLKPLMAADSNRVLASFELGVCVLEVDTADDQPATREVPCSDGAVGLRLGFNLATMRSALASLNEDEVTLQMAHEKLPILIEEGDYTAVLMPIKGGAPARARDRASARKPRF